MDHYSDYIQDQRGNAIAGATVLVTQSGVPSTLYSDNGVTLQANPMTTDARGAYSFYAANGTYDLAVTRFDVTVVPETSPVTLFDLSVMVPRTGLDTVSLTLEECFGEVLNVWSLVGSQIANGVYDASSTLQTAIDYAATNGLTLWSPAGNYYCGTRLFIPSNLTWLLDPNAIHVGHFASTGNSGFLGQPAAMAVKISNVLIRGGEFRKADKTDANKGRIISLYGDDIRIESLTARTFGHGGAMFIGGNRVFVDKFRAFDPLDDVGVAGLRVYGGGASDGTPGVMVTNSYVESGDDTFQFVPAEIGAPISNLDIWNSSFANCVGNSTQARLCLTGIGNSSTTDALSCSIRNSGFYNVRGRSGTAALVQMFLCSGSIQDIVFSNVVSKCGVERNGNGYGIEFNIGTNNTGVINNITFDGLVADTPFAGSRIAGAGITSGVWIRGCNLGTPVEVGSVGLTVLGVNGGGVILGSRVTGYEDDAISLGGSGTDVVTAFDVLESTLTSGNSGGTAQYGVVVVGLSSGINVKRNIIKPQAGSTNARAVSMADGATYVVVEDNDTSALTGGVFYRFAGNLGNVIDGNGSAARLVQTTDATFSTLVSCTIANNTAVTFEGTVLGRRQSGSAGASEDSAMFVCSGLFRNVAGVVTVVGFTATAFKDQAGWDIQALVSGTSVLIQVKGAVNNTVWWACPGALLRKLA